MRCVTGAFELRSLTTLPVPPPQPHGCQEVSIQLLVQHHAQLPAAMLPTMMVTASNPPKLEAPDKLMPWSWCLIAPMNKQLR